MKKRNFLLAMLFLLGFYYSRATSDTSVLAIKSVSVIPNTIGEFYLFIDFRIDFENQIVDDDYLHAKSTEKPKFRIIYQNRPSEGSCIEARMYGSPLGFGVKVSGFTDKEIQYFLAKDNQIGVQCGNDFFVRYYNTSIENPHDSDLKYGIVKADDINKMIKNNLTITDSDRSGYITAINNFYYHDNKVDFGVEPGTAAKQTSYFLTADIRNKYSAKNFLSCSKAKNNMNKPKIFWTLSTRLSTNFSDSLNFIKFSPINFSWPSKNFSKELNINIAHESDQMLTNKRVCLDGSYRFIIPNLVNLTTQKDSRLRLKPIIRIGGKGYEDYSDNISSFASGQAYLKGYYYIPVYNNYSIIIEGTAFYDFSTQRNADHKVTGNYSITIASELPSTGFKAILKFVNGQSDIDNQTGQLVLVGLLMDFFQDQDNLMTKSLKKLQP